MKKSTGQVLADIPGEILKLPVRATRGVGYLVVKGFYGTPVRRLLEIDNPISPLFLAVSSGPNIGFSYGLGYDHRRHFTPGDDFDFAATYSVHHYQTYRLRYRAPRLFSSHVGGSFLAGYRKETRERFYGLGNSTSEDDEVVLSRETGQVHGELSWEVAPKLVAAFSAGYTSTHLYDGDDSEYEGRLDTVQTRFDLGDGELRSSRVLSADTRLAFDFRNNVVQPSHGGMAVASIAYNKGLGDFDDLEFVRSRVELYGYFELFLKRILAVRVIAQSVDKPAGSPAVPIYLKSSLGGYSDLRGFRSSRLVDDDMVVITLEYRYPVLHVVDAFIFLDEGRVFPSITDDISWGQWLYSTGVGFRVHGRRSVLLTTLLAFSREAVRFHLQMGADW